MTATSADRGLESPEALLAATDRLRRGRVLDAIRLLGAVRDDSGAAAGVRALAGALLVDGHLARGHLESALSLDEQLVREAAHDGAADLPEARLAHAEIAAALGDVERAVDRFLAVPTAGCGATDDVSVPWRVGVALALVRAGRRHEALAHARTQHTLAEARGSVVDRALALRVLAAVEPGRTPRLERALALLSPGESDRLRAQIGTDLAGLLALEGRRDEAVVLLRDAERYAAREDLWPLQGRVRRLLERLGEPARRTDAETLAVLTAAERRVVLAAIHGGTNREIAARLAISVKAVEGHLSKAYRKLEVGSRPGLIALLGPRG